MNKVVSFVLMLTILSAIALPFSVVAVDQTTQQLQSGDVLPGQDASNRFLSAELTKNMNQQTADIISKVNAYNDENFQVFDGRLSQFIIDAKMKMILAAAGASLITTSIALLFMLRQVKHYSYEKYQEKLLMDKTKQEEAKQELPKGIQQMQKEEWQPQQPAQTMSMEYGQAQAAQMSQMNAWQAQPAYDGSWRAPIETTPEYSRVPGNVSVTPPEHVPFRVETEDPMQSPGWDPRQGGY